MAPVALFLLKGFAKKYAWRDQATAEGYDRRRFERPLQRVKHGRDVGLVRKLLERAGGVRTVLDLPCGTGRLFEPLQAAGYRLLGADISPEMIAQRGGEDAQLGVVLADSESLPLKEGALDAVVSLRFLFHVREDAAREGILREMGRVANRAVVGQVRYRSTLKHLGRWLRSRVGLSRKYRPSQGHREIEAELARAGLELMALAPVSRLFSDKALFLARPR